MKLRLVLTMIEGKVGCGGVDQRASHASQRRHTPCKKCITCKTRHSHKLNTGQNCDALSHFSECGLDDSSKQGARLCLGHAGDDVLHLRHLALVDFDRSALGVLGTLTHD